MMKTDRRRTSWIRLHEPSKDMDPKEAFPWIAALNSLRFRNPEFFKIVMNAVICDGPNRYHKSYLKAKYPDQYPDLDS